ncbi:MAG: hypothetical protein HW373_64 [Deltaproteobacteria bacterium]|nr:hypothetical protein [Deltaproteobacteria bacterium]
MVLPVFFFWVNWGVAYPFTPLRSSFIEPPRAWFFVLALQFFFFQW